MKILITGGAGFIGANFVRYWHEHHKDEIVVLDKLTYASNKDYLKGLKIKFIQGDICNPKIVAKACKGVSLIVHFAAETHVDRSIKNPDIFLKTNILGTHMLLKEALKKNIRFHHVSTDEVFGSVINRVKENYRYDPSSPYAASKAAADHIVRAYYKTYGLPITISNCTNNFGRYQYPEKLIPLTIKSILEDKKVPIYGDGKQKRDWLYVLDHCRAIELIIKKGKIGETYNISGISDINNLELVKRIIRMMGKGEYEFVKDRLGHDVKYALDSSKLKKLGFKLKYDFDKALIDTIKYEIEKYGME